MVANTKIDARTVGIIQAEHARGVSAPDIRRMLATRGIVVSDVAVRNHVRKGRVSAPQDAPGPTTTMPPTQSPAPVTDDVTEAPVEFDAVRLIDAEIQRTLRTASETESDSARTAASGMIIKLVECRVRLAGGGAVGSTSILDALGRILGDEDVSD
jgi:hypothetical protein